VQESRSPSKEYVTLVVMVIIYLSWAALTWFHQSIPNSLLFVLGGLTVCWYGSFQHETIHGHPTRKRWLNSLLGYAPLGLVYPYPIYRDSHLEHHDVDHLTHPEKDPESFYFLETKWRELSPPAQAILKLNHTLAGRLTVGPILVAGVFLWGEVRNLWRGEKRYLQTWLIHIVMVAAVLHWVVAVCGMPLLTYLVCFAYPGLSMTLLRSYLEHRPAEVQEHRSAVVEGRFFSLLFMGVNYHYLHHRDPWIPWYELGRRYHAQKEEILEENGGYQFDNYSEVVRRHAFCAKDSPVFPDPLR
jgi:fatty acid desaturase